MQFSTCEEQDQGLKGFERLLKGEGGGANHINSRDRTCTVIMKRRIARRRSSRDCRRTHFALQISSSTLQIAVKQLACDSTSFEQTEEETKEKGTRIEKIKDERGGDLCTKKPLMTLMMMDDDERDDDYDYK